MKASPTGNNRRMFDPQRDARESYTKARGLANWLTSDHQSQALP
jgi:hypothetical protein